MKRIIGCMISLSISSCLSGASLGHDGSDIEGIYLDDLRSKARNYLGAYAYDENPGLQSGIIIKALTVFGMQDSADDYSQIAFEDPLIDEEGKVMGIKNKLSKSVCIGYHRLTDLDAEVIHKK